MQVWHTVFPIFSLLSEGAVAVPNAGFGQGTGDVLQYMFDCNGDEDNLLMDCPSDEPPNICTHSDDAGVICCVGKLDFRLLYITYWLSVCM